MRIIKVILALALMIFLLLVATVWAPKPKNVVSQQQNNLILGQIAGKTLKIEVADSPAEREIGLSYRKSLPEDQGLLFVFEKPDFYGFWMKDMNFPLDFLWINENFEVVDISKNITTSTYPDLITPKSPAQYVLEVNAGLIDKKAWKIGDRLEIYPHTY